MNRRDFLRPAHLAQSAGTVLGAVAELPDGDTETEPCQEDTLLRFARRAMATEFEVALPFSTPNAHGAAQAALDRVDELEAQLTVYRDSSELSQLNARAAQAAVRVEPELFGLLQDCKWLHAESDGAFDVSAGALIKAWGFFRGTPRVPEKLERLAALECVGMQHVTLDSTAFSVQFLRPGLEVNLGSIGKGYALDRCAKLLRNEWNVQSGLLHGGHSSVYAMGCPPGNKAGWEIGISHPWRAEQRLTVVRLRDCGMGTSAASYRHLEWQGKKLGHILDPRTGWPAEGVASATAIAPTAAEADALATGFYINGVGWTRDYVAAHADVSAVLLVESSPEVYLFGKDVSTHR